MKFIITGIGRSGTKYTSDLLNTAGISCGWEKAFQVNKRNINWDKTIGDASWLAAPFILELPKNTIILHQTRNPLNWLNSWLKVTPDWGHHHTHFVDSYCGFFRWKDGTHPQVDMKLYVKWNEMIENAAKSSNLTYLRYKIEDLDFPKLMEISKLTRSKVQQIQAFNAIQQVNKKTNASKPSDTYVPVTWDTLPQCQELEDFKAITLRYGYAIE